MRIFAPTFDGNFSGSTGVVTTMSSSVFSGSFVGDGSGILGVISASYSSYALTASYVSGSGGGTTYTFSTGLTTSSNTITADLSTGRSGGQSVIGGTGASENLTLTSTSDSAKGKILFGTSSAYDDLRARIGIGTTSPSNTLHINTNTGATNASSVETIRYSITTTGTGSANYGQQIGFYSKAFNTENSLTAYILSDLRFANSDTLYGGRLRFFIRNNASDITLLHLDGNAGGQAIFNNEVYAPTIYATSNIYGGNSAGNNLNLKSNSTATKGKIFFGTSSAFDDVNDRLGIGTTAPSDKLHVSGSVLAHGDITVNATNSTTSSPRIFGAKSFSTGQAISFRFGDSNNVFQNYNGGRMQLGSFWALELYGNRQGATSFVPSGNPNAHTLIYGAQASNVILVVSASSGQSANLQEFRNSTGTTLSGVTSNGSFLTPSVIGSTGASGTLTLSTTSNATKGKIIFGASSSYDEANDRLGIGTTSPAYKLDVSGSSRYQGDVNIGDGTSVVIGSSTGTKFGTATTQKIGFFDATPIVQPASSVAINDVLVNLGLRASGGSSSFSADIDIRTKNIITDTSTGTKIGTDTAQLLGFWNAPPVAQPTTLTAGATFVAGGGTGLTSTDTFDGYTLRQVVKALRNVGILA